MQCGLVGLNRVLHASGFVEHIAEIEVSERIARVGLNGLAIVLFGEAEFLAIVVERAEIDVRGGVRGLEFQHSADTRRWPLPAMLGSSSSAMPRAKPCGHFTVARSGLRLSAPACWSALSRAPEKSIRNWPAIGSSNLPFVTEGDAMFRSGPRAPASSRGFSTPDGLLAHGIERLANDCRTHAHGAQVADFLDFQEIGKGIGLGGRDQAIPLPVGQLARRDAENPQ